MNFIKLESAIRAKKSFLCVGLDPDLNRIPTYLLNYDDSVFDYRSGDMFSPKLENTEAIEKEISHFCECIDGATCISGPDLGRRVVELIECTNKSMDQKGCPVYV